MRWEDTKSSQLNCNYSVKLHFKKAIKLYLRYNQYTKYYMHICIYVSIYISIYSRGIEKENINTIIKTEIKHNFCCLSLFKRKGNTNGGRQVVWCSWKNTARPGFKPILAPHQQMTSHKFTLPIWSGFLIWCGDTNAYLQGLWGLNEKTQS